MIDVEHVTKNYGQVKALTDATLHLQNHECVALIGANGCGKTTLIKSILQIVLPTSGTILFESQSIKNTTSYKNNIGYMPQIGRYPAHMTIQQLINTLKDIRNTQKPLDEELYYEFQLNKISNKQMGSLSGGTTQKVSATIAFLFNPAVLILDEPTAGLDPIAAEILKQKIIKEKNSDKLILITSHLLSELDDFVSEVVFMRDGKILFHKKVNDLLQQVNQQTISKAILHILQKGITW